MRKILLIVCVVLFRDIISQIEFSFKNKNLIEIIDLLAAKKNINIVLPQAPIDAEIIKKQTITFQPDNTENMPLDQAWDLLLQFLELSGFSLYEKEKNLFAITRTGKTGEVGISQEPLPLYIGIKPKDLPNNQERIRYIYYLKNLKVPEPGQDNPISQILKDMGSPGSSEPIYLQKPNGFIITDKSNVIASIITIIAELDSSGFKESIEVLPLYNVPAIDVAKIFETLKKASGDQPPAPFIREDNKISAISYFAFDTKIVPDVRNNSLILMGRESAVSRISSFIGEYIDNPPESGNSILHTYDLQYLSAKEFAPVLQDMVKVQQITNAQGTQSNPTGPYRFFQGVIVIDEPITDIKLSPSQIATNEVIIEKDSNIEIKGITGQQTTGGNRIIVAALQEDWIYIRDIIQKLDIPQPQVILEVYIIDFIHNSRNVLASTLRSKTGTPTQIKGLEYLASHITPVGNVLGTNPTQLAQDLLGVTGPNSVTSQINPGSVLISLNDPLTPGIMGLLQILNRIVNVKIISHPFLISTNNQKATVLSEITKRARGDIAPNANGSFIINVENIKATINLELIPHIAQIDNHVKLEIGVTIDDFVGATLNRITRGLSSCATMETGQILAIGGLIRQEENVTTTYTPILGQIPLIGWLFKGESRTIEKSNLAIIISPTILKPKNSLPVDLYTSDKILDSYSEIDQEFIPENDPISRLFFDTSNRDNTDLAQEYLGLSSNISSDFLPKPKTIKNNNYSKIKNMLAFENNPLLVKQTKNKTIFNA